MTHIGGNAMWQWGPRLGDMSANQGTQGWPATTRSGKRQGRVLPSSLWRKRGPDSTSISGLLLPEWWETRCLWFQVTQRGVPCYVWQPQDRNAQGIETGSLLHGSWDLLASGDLGRQGVRGINTLILLPSPALVGAPQDDDHHHRDMKSGRWQLRCCVGHKHGILKT